MCNYVLEDDFIHRSLVVIIYAGALLGNTNLVRFRATDDDDIDGRKTLPCLPHHRHIIAGDGRFIEQEKVELRRWGGREVTEAGDGFLALFDDPAHGIVCAAAIRDRVGALGLDVRCGLHLGQLEEQAGGSAGGIAVHVGARVAGEAGPGEVLVTSAVRDAESGSGFEFEDLGYRALKGVDREWRLFRLTGLPQDVSDLEPGAWGRCLGAGPVVDLGAGSRGRGAATA